MTSKKGTSQVKTHFRNSWYTLSSQFTRFFPKKNHVKQELHKWRKNITNILSTMILTQKPHNVKQEFRSFLSTANQNRVN